MVPWKKSTQQQGVKNEGGKRQKKQLQSHASLSVFVFCELYGKIWKDAVPFANSCDGVKTLMMRVDGSVDFSLVIITTKSTLRFCRWAETDEVFHRPKPHTSRSRLFSPFCVMSTILLGVIISSNHSIIIDFKRKCRNRQKVTATTIQGIQFY